MLERALQLANEGFRVFPLGPKSKQPYSRFTGWQHRASHNHRELRRWFGHDYPDANIGLRTGWYGALCLTVIEVDERHGGYDWLVGQRDLFVPTYVVLSGSGHGKHFYYWSEVEIRNSQGTETTGIAAGVDVRGEGGYVLPAGADHPSGGTYHVGCSLPIATMPPALTRAVLPPVLPKSVVTAPAPLSERPAADAILRKYLALSRPGNQNRMLFEMARQLIGNGYDDIEGMRCMYQYIRTVPQTAKDPWTNRDADSVWRSAHNYAILQPWPSKIKSVSP